MPQVVLDIPAAVANRVMDAIAARHGYNALTDGTKAAFCKKFIIELVMQEVRTYERDRDTKIAYAATDAAVVSEVVIT